MMTLGSFCCSVGVAWRFFNVWALLYSVRSVECFNGTGTFVYWYFFVFYLRILFKASFSTCVKIYLV